MSRNVTPEEAAAILDRMADRLGSGAVLTALQPYFMEGMRHVRTLMAQYGDNRGKPGVFKDAAHRRKVAAMIRMGLITVPYPRTNRLASAWLDTEPQVTVSDTTMTGTLAPNAPVYGKWVMGSVSQSAFHRQGGGWMTTQQRLPRALDAVIAELLDGVRDILPELLK